MLVFFFTDFNSLRLHAHVYGKTLSLELQLSHGLPTLRESRNVASNLGIWYKRDGGQH